MITIENNQECFVALWRRLERTRQLFGMQYRRFCIRHVMTSWFGAVHDDTIWEVCARTVVDERQYYGLDELPAPALQPRACREFLRALVAVNLGIGMRKVDVKALDEAYTKAFPHSTPLNVNKKRHRRTAGGIKGRTAGGIKGRTTGVRQTTCGDSSKPP